MPPHAPVLASTGASPTDPVELPQPDAQALRYSASLFGAAFRDSPLPLCITGRATGRFLEANDAFIAYFGYTRAEVIGKTSLELGIWDDLAARAETMALLDHGDSVHEHPVLFRTRAGERRRAALSLERTTLDDLGDECILGCVVDLSRHNAAAASLERANQQLQRALLDLETAQARQLQEERLRALGQMAAGIAHDLNNALAPVVGFADLLLDVPDGLSDTARTARYLELIRSGAHDAAAVVARLRAFYRPGDTPPPHASAGLPPLLREAAAAGPLLSTTRPLDPDAARAVAPATPPLARAARASLTVLVVDDDPAVRAVTAGYLALDGHTTIEAGTGDDALPLLAGPCDLVITDHAMPGSLSGEALAAEVGRRRPGTPVLLLTGYGDVLSGLPPAPGVTAVLTKPITLALLRAAVARAVPSAAALS